MRSGSRVATAEFADGRNAASILFRTHFCGEYGERTPRAPAETADTRGKMERETGFEPATLSLEG
jgi:hypothetical protein